VSSNRIPSARVACRRTVLALTAVAALAAVAPPAAADSIAYVKDGDVWLATPDGGRQYRVTASGGYSDVSQADDGTLIGLHGVRLHRLDRGGNLLADFDTPVSDTRPEGHRVFYGPYDPALSPDGRRLAYTYYYVGKGTAPGCLPPNCMTTVTEGGTGYSHADRQTAWDEPGLGRHSGWRNPSWIDDATTMISDPTHLPNPDVLLDPVGDGRPGDDGFTLDWFSDTGTTHLGAGEMDRARTKLAFQAGDDDASVRIYRLTGPYPALPQACYSYDGITGGVRSAPSWAPDGRRLAWAHADGIRVVDVPDLAGGCTQVGASPEGRLIVAGATQPDWGPADVPAGEGRASAGAGGGAPVPGDGSRGGSGPAVPAPVGSATRVSFTVTAASLRAGVKIRVKVPGTGRVAGTATAGRTTVARAASRKVRRAGTVTLTLRSTAKGRRALRRVRSRRVTVRVTFRTPGTTPLTATRSGITMKGGRR
jgi:hypothetical protein